MNYSFNIRVYGIISYTNRYLILKEPFQKKLIHKFPGGGLEFGEGTIECLKRECLEELNITLKNIQHYYTQDYYIKDGLNPNRQLLLIYYTAEINDINTLKILDENIQEALWLTLEELNQDLFFLPTDKLIAKNLGA